ncbi:ABC transporter ATP-binding protein [Phorcysia thermohydrogeniphila]|uniref:Phospholipid/cholesterol/gamma-HCH transport system ATP-binding protein n=1 Tax=Phorcysia thermohydrogeniphila TaxID=936138 RepID=A0A4R1GAS9_9BACT|nr:ABC transporter ATP-binding protein [Phorcysia thermohydrogeniphila]TCK05317.1 phospholipid/cholesterol/gamma-HCH transport system ATP-binding protein [Phorcysia thermohydrogeniphila]TCK05327.1 phospholipid/cholesterol/gamma-HCH transport system ATP-binding protein [Phorcysia thermohydrogeniphila]
MKEAIVVEDLKKSFGTNVVHDGVSFTVYDGEIFVVIGPSGTGKSVLLKQIAGLLKPDSGKIYVYGMDVLNLSGEEFIRFRETLTYVFQNGALFDSLPVWYNVAFYLVEKKGIKEKEAREKAKYYLSLLGLSGTEDLYPSELSGGMRKRVAVARALCMNPRCILFDEPTSGLDPVMTAVLDRLILKLKKEFGKTCVVVSHDMTSAFRIADRIAILWGGKVVEIGTPEEIKKSENPVVKQFINGEPDGPITAMMEL